MSLRVGVVGCGVVGRRRVEALAGAKLAVCMDTDPSRAHAAAQLQGAQVVNRFEDVVSSPNVDVVVVSTTNDALSLPYA